MLGNKQLGVRLLRHPIGNSARSGYPPPKEMISGSAPSCSNSRMADGRTRLIRLAYRIVTADPYPQKNVSLQPAHSGDMLFILDGAKQ
jgi:hypothetical protein